MVIFPKASPLLHAVEMKTCLKTKISIVLP